VVAGGRRGGDDAVGSIREAAKRQKHKRAGRGEKESEKRGLKTEDPCLKRSGTGGEEGEGRRCSKKKRGGGGRRKPMGRGKRGASRNTQ